MMEDYSVLPPRNKIRQRVLQFFLVLLAFCILFNVEWIFQLINQNQLNKSQTEPTRHSRPQVPVLYIRDENSTIADEKAWFTGRYRNGAVMLASANFGAANSSMLANMLCSLTRNAPLTLNALVIWATDIEAAHHLTNISTSHYNSSFGVYYYNTTLPSTLSSGSSNSGLYFQLMAGRNAFFEWMVSTLGLNFLFTDLDTVFLNDPFVALNIPYGISNVTFDSLDAPEGNTSLGGLYDLIPDLVSCVFPNRSCLLFDKYLSSPNHRCTVPTIDRIQGIVLHLFVILLCLCLLFNIEWMFRLTMRNQLSPKLQPAQNSPNRPYVPVLYIRDENSTVADEKSWFTGRYRNGAVMLASANFGAANSSMLANMLCSLRKNAPLALDALVI
ncbi:hypothetical protein BCR33DRAFT_381731 [Rhizoclosmatium globosum]|uniref:Nucleotide-diphospho-sugar transferase domain-containing protein n=1 Tax=Rhizoclosmatium globosum TaxID=329046 RepID=A0A1Y1ZMM4_9FUNG|nr:hypothetical protein BCR33DRAFT_381731 [Rhizoclosmatium globosum]|eukprot:ORY11478.1 hypothetical protein BCR33DRAFT_381731 [Rhizoclosmatium globosum]